MKGNKKYSSVLVGALLATMRNDNPNQDIITIQKDTEESLVNNYNAKLDAMIENARKRNHQPTQSQE
ncbi:MAG: hypothetical protein JNL32_04840 [Candidatus Kapabacteria bacterium]|nr:hypothetical protein [Candidatus Kapabacteria bacterium]